jgi:hypothetical protein
MVLGRPFYATVDAWNLTPFGNFVSDSSIYLQLSDTYITHIIPH